jgi:hypothetical protein
MIAGTSPGYGKPSSKIIKDAPDASLMKPCPGSYLAEWKSLMLQTQDLTVGRRTRLEHALP